MLLRGVRQAGDDLAAAVDEVRQLRANNGALAAQLAAAAGGGGPGAWEDAQRQLAAVGGARAGPRGCRRGAAALALGSAGLFFGALAR